MDSDSESNLLCGPIKGLWEGDSSPLYASLLGEDSLLFQVISAYSIDSVTMAEREMFGVLKDSMCGWSR